jgi:hypothetical protein
VRRHYHGSFDRTEDRVGDERKLASYGSSKWGVGLERYRARVRRLLRGTLGSHYTGRVPRCAPGAIGANSTVTSDAVLVADGVYRERQRAILSVPSRGGDRGTR